jgi:hypothetical protein
VTEIPGTVENGNLADACFRNTEFRLLKLGQSGEFHPTKTSESPHRYLIYVTYYMLHIRRPLLLSSTMFLKQPGEPGDALENREFGNVSMVKAIFK